MTTEITDSTTMAAHAMEVMDANAARIRAVVTRLLSEIDLGNLPPLLAVRTDASGGTARDTEALVTFQASTAEDASAWARALGVELTHREEDSGFDERVALRAWVNLSFDGVAVRLVSYQTFTPAQWAERSAVVVAA